MLESFNAATGERLGAVARTDPAELAAIVADIAEVQPFWAQLPLSDRARYMRRTAQVVIDRLDELATLVSREQGKPRSESYSMELVPSIDALHWIAAHAERIIGGERIRTSQPYFVQKRSQFAFEPLGVIGVISPWSFPWAIPFAQIAIALMCGNGVVFKPASLTPLVGERVQQVFEWAGIPEGLVRTVHGGADVGRALVDAGVAKVFFTGSATAGRDVAARCAEQGKGAVLELGGNDAQVVLADAEAGHAVAGCLWGAFANAGQASSGIERVYVARELGPRFIDGVVEGAGRLRVGDPLDPLTDIGPMASREQFDRVCALVDDAVAEGAELHCGGPLEITGLSGPFFAPAVLTGVRPEMRVMREQVFGPVVPIVEFDSEEEAIRLANGTDFGLGASVWTLDRGKGTRIARRLETGTVWINDHMYSHAAVQTSWGGVKRSGYGRNHSKFGFYECVNVKHIAWDPSRARNFWWFPYDGGLPSALHASVRLLYGRDADKRQALREGAAPIARIARRTLRGILGE